MLARDKQILELREQVEHLQERLDELRDDFRILEKFTTNRICKNLDDRFKYLEDYLNIELVVDNTCYKMKNSEVQDAQTSSHSANWYST